MIEACLGRVDGKVIFPEGFAAWSGSKLSDCVSAIKGSGWTAGSIAEVVGCTSANIEALLKNRQKTARGYRTTTFEVGLRIAVLWWIVTTAAPVENAPRRHATADRTALSRCASQVRSALVSARHRAG